MKKERYYIAYLDDRHDYHDFYYTSTHRNKSAANLQDLRDQLPRHLKNVNIKSTWLTDRPY